MEATFTEEVGQAPTWDPMDPWEWVQHATKNGFLSSIEGSITRALKSHNTLDENHHQVTAQPLATKTEHRLDQSKTNHTKDIHSSIPKPQPQPTGLLSYLPTPWIPYAELARLDKPLACLFLYFPCLFGTLLAASTSSPPLPPSALLRTNAIFLLGSFLVRCVGCTWNDIIDQDIDRLVTRTRLRPLARRAISTSDALIFTLVQLAVGLRLVTILMPPVCLYYSVPSIAGTALYPFGKRFTNYPQLILGVVFSWGVVMAFPAFGLGFEDVGGRTVVAAGCLFGSCVAWTVLYDTIYAAQDVEDDKKVGAGSPVVKHGENTWRLLVGIAVVQIALLVCAGVAMRAGVMFFGSACGGTALVAGLTVMKVDLGNPKDCTWWFKKGPLFAAICIGVGFGVEYGMRLEG